VDIVQTPDSLRVLEINSGIMMEYFATRHPQGEALARRIYATLLEQMFAEPPIRTTPWPDNQRRPTDTL